MDYTGHVEEIGRRVKAASRVVADMPAGARTAVLVDIASALRRQTDAIIAANRHDLDAAAAAGISGAFLDRLRLDAGRIEAMARSVEDISRQDDPVGRIESMQVRPSGIRVGRMRVPVGVVAVIFESRPNVTTDIAALAIRSGNAAILRGGSESLRSNLALYAVIADVLDMHGLSRDAVHLIDNPDRELVTCLLKLDRYIDIVIPRGGHGLISMVTRESTIPVIKHDKGVCHAWVHASADPEMAEKIVLNAKTQRPGVCNALETLLVDADYPHTVRLLEACAAAGVELRGCARAAALLPGRVVPATDEDWAAEYLELILAVRIVDGFEAARAHIDTWGSGHSEAVITSDYATAQRFLREIDSAAVFVNASTRFHDGGELGLGAEVGISTQKLHARGAMGVEGLTCLKYVVYGEGQVRQ